MVEDRLREELRALEKRPGIELVILFGSRAKGYARPDSDLDVAISSEKPLDLLEITNDLIQATHLNDIDVVDLHRCGPLLGMRILNEGEVLVRKPGALGRIGSYICRRYADTKKFRQAGNRYLDLFLSKRGSI